VKSWIVGAALASACAGPALFVSACAVTEEATPSKTDAGHLPEGDAGQPPDASPDAQPDAGPARTCSDDGFCHTSLPPDRTVNGIWADGQGIAWAVTEEGDVLRWESGAWKVHASDLGPLRAVWGSGPTSILVGGELGLYEAAGDASAALTFSPVETPEPAQILSIWGTGPGDVWAVGGTFAGDPESGLVLHRSGTDWEVDAASSAGLSFARVWGSATAGVWLAGTAPIPDEFFEEVHVLRRRPGEATFDELTLPPDPDDDPIFGKMAVLADATLAGSEVLVLGRSIGSVPGVWRGKSHDGGQTYAFSYQRGGRFDDPPVNAVRGVGANEAWAAGDYGRLARWDGTSWSQAAIAITKFPVTDPLYALWTDGTEVWAAGGGIALHREKKK
jgi:hypothetical protein